MIGATDSRATAALARRDALATLRSPMEPLWNELSTYVRPMRGGFSGGTTAGKSPAAKLFDGTAAQAATNLAAGLFGLITNPANKWFMVQHSEPDLAMNAEIAAWCDHVTTKIAQAFSGGGMGFYARLPTLYADLAAFGTGVFYVDEDVKNGRLWFSARHLRECYLAENDREEVDSVYRSFEMSARAAVMQWGDAVGEKIVKAAEKEPEKRFRFLHVVEPNPDQKPGRIDAAGMAFRSLYVAEDEKRLIAAGGYHEMPYMVPRWSRGESAPYGDGPAVLALPDIKMVNTMAKTTLLAAELAARPPLVAPDELAVRGIRFQPGAVMYGGVDMAGNQLVRPLAVGGRPDLSLQMEEQRRGVIRDAFHWGLLLMVGQPNRTATEVLEMQEEKLRLMAPHFGNIQSEFLNPLIDRVFGLLFRAGQLPPPPEIMSQYPGGLRVEYVSPLARAAKTAEGAAIQRALAAIMPLAQADPTVMDNIDADATARALADAYGVPPTMLRDPKVVDQLRQQRQQAAMAAQQQAMMAQAAPGGAM